MDSLKGRAPFLKPYTKKVSIIFVLLEKIFEKNAKKQVARRRPETLQSILDLESDLAVSKDITSINRICLEV